MFHDKNDSHYEVLKLASRAHCEGALILDQAVVTLHASDVCVYIETFFSKHLLLQAGCYAKRICLSIFSLKENC